MDFSALSPAWTDLVPVPIRYLVLPRAASHEAQSLHFALIFARNINRPWAGSKSSHFHVGLGLHDCCGLNVSRSTDRPIGRSSANAQLSALRRLRAFLARVIGWVHISDDKRPLQVYLHDGAGRGVGVVMHIRGCDGISSRRQRYGMSLVDQIAHAKREGALQNRDILVSKVKMRRNNVPAGISSRTVTRPLTAGSPDITANFTPGGSAGGGGPHLTSFADRSRPYSPPRPTSAPQDSPQSKEQRCELDA